MFPRYHSTCIYRSQLWSLKSIFVAVSSRRVQSWNALLRFLPRWQNTIFYWLEYFWAENLLSEQHFFFFSLQHFLIFSQSFLLTVCRDFRQRVWMATRLPILSSGHPQITKAGKNKKIEGWNTWQLWYTVALWSGTNKNKDVRTGPLTHPFARTAHSWERELLMSQNDLVLFHSGLPMTRLCHRLLWVHLVSLVRSSVWPSVRPFDLPSVRHSNP